MSSQVKLKNENGGTTIISSGTQSGDVSTEVSIVVDTINDFPTTAYDGMVCIVKDLDRGGTFVYDSSEVANDNQGTNFNGWVRQYSGAVHVKWFGAKGDGVTDDTVAIETALTLGYKTVEFGEELTYNFSGFIDITNDIRIKGNGSTLNGITSSAYIRARGSIDSEIPVTDTLYIGDNTITAVNSFSKDDIVIIRDDTDYSYSLHRYYYKKGEYLKVSGSTGTAFTVEGGVRQVFNDVTNLKVSKLNPITVHIDGLNIYNQLATDYVLSLMYTRDSTVTNCNINGGVLRAFTVTLSYNTVLNNNVFYHDTGTITGYDYGLSISNCAFTYATNCQIHGARHATGIGGSNENGAVPNYYTFITDCTLSNNRASNLYVADIHGNSESTKYEGCYIEGAIAMGGENTSYVNNTINLLTDRPAVDLTEVVGGEMRLEGNIISVIGNSGGTYNTVMNASDGYFTDDISYDVTYIVENNVFALSNNIEYLILLYKSASGSAVLNLIYENNRFRNDCSGLLGIVRNYNYNYLTKTQEFITIRDFHKHSSMSTSVQIFINASGTLTNTKLTLPKIGYNKSITTLSGTYWNTIYFALPFDYGTYKPMAHADVLNRQLVGTVIPFATTNNTTVGCSLSVTSGNTGETFGIDFTWEVSVEFGGTQIL